MIKFIVGMLVGGFFGMAYMCLSCIVDDFDEFDEFTQEPEQEEELRCSFCGGKLSGIWKDDDGRPYRHCFGCHFDYDVDGSRLYAECEPLDDYEDDDE